MTPTEADAAQVEVLKAWQTARDLGTQLAEESNRRARALLALRRVAAMLKRSYAMCENLAHQAGQKQRELAAERRAHEATRAALRNLVKINEEWNCNIEAVIGRPVGWTDSYLDTARAALKGGE